jgi:hypothetical protein
VWLGRYQQQLIEYQREEIQLLRAGGHYPPPCRARPSAGGEIDASSGLPSRGASIREPSAEIHSLWGVLHPAREARARRLTGHASRS